MPVSNSCVVGLLLLERRRRAVDRVALLRVGDRALAVDRLAEQVEDAAQALLAHRHRDRRAGVGRLHAAHQAVGRGHRDAAHDVVADVQRDLDREVDAARRVLDQDRVVDRRQLRPGSNSTSTVGPITCTTLPLRPSTARAVACACLLQRFGAADDLRRSPCVIVAWRSRLRCQDQRVDQLARVLACRAHGHHARRVLGGAATRPAPGRCAVVDVARQELGREIASASGSKM